MQYQSTRGGDIGKSFEQILLATYASDGGLYVPAKLPLLSMHKFEQLRNLDFSGVCAEVLHLFTGIETDVLQKMASTAFSAFNDGQSPPLPILKVGGVIVLNASFGPTYSFKDVGLQMIAPILNYVLNKRGEVSNIVVETSGDTGPAAVHAVRNCLNVNIFCLYPHKRISDVQELQMTTVHNENVHIFRTDVDSDEQASVLKRLFSDQEFVQKYNICSVNSINWLRIAAQSSYYIWAYLQIHKTSFSIGQPVNFVIPTGAFGNALSGMVAKRMGLPINKIICSTNANDIVHRTICYGDMSMKRNVATESPAMDVQFAYNLERMLYYVCNENPDIIRPIMMKMEKQFALTGESEGCTLDPIIVQRIQELFISYSVSNEETMATIQNMYQQHNYLLCPHSATAVHTAKLSQFENIIKGVPTVCVLTAHPAKFESTIQRAVGVLPELPLNLSKMKSVTPKFMSLTSSSEAVNSADVDWKAQWVEILRKEIIKNSCL